VIEVFLIQITGEKGATALPSSLTHHGMKKYAFDHYHLLKIVGMLVGEEKGRELSQYSTPKNH